ncbi:MAG TPA: ATPase, T2SS/T4P/T4SS family [Planctomycetota bacterium]
MNDTKVARKPLVFCVDDDASLLDWMDLALSDQGWDVQTEADPKKALERIAAQPPDVILLDVTMPVLDGYQVCERLQKIADTSYIPVIFVTGLGGERDRAKAFLVGGVDHLVKPVNEEALRKAVAHHIATKGKFNEIRKVSQRPAPPRAGGPQRWDAAFQPSVFARFKEALAGRLKLGPDKLKSLGRLTPDALYSGAAELGVSGRQVTETLAAFLNLPYLPRVDPQQVRLGVLPTPFCRSNQVLATGDVDFVLTNPFRWEILEVIRRAVGADQAPRLSLAEPDAFEVLSSTPSARPATRPAAAPSGTIDQMHYELRKELEVSASVSAYAVEAQNAGPLVELMNRLIEAAHDAGASDIHIEPTETDVVVRYRIDGDLTIANRFQPAELHKRMIARLKVMSQLDIAEHRLPQDGRIEFKAFTQRRDVDIDLRVAIIPVRNGEKACLRLLDKQKAVLPLEKLGFSPRNLALYREKIRTPYGMILHVGPTGSGKSMSLYAALNEIKSPTTNIQTAEDPIEYTLPGINQMQVMPDIGLTFSRALRSFLRVDPDIILVGETRDVETAKIAVEASLTGHLLFSTMHTNDAASTVTRFVEMGIEPYLISSSLTLVCAQRLIRRLCPECKEAYTPDEAQREIVGAKAGETLYRARGCARCGGLGYKGRIAVHELLAPNAAVRAAILKKGVSAEELKRVAVREGGMTSLYWDAMEKVRQGLCSVEDALQNVRRDDDDTVPPWA